MINYNNISTVITLFLPQAAQPRDKSKTELTKADLDAATNH